ncbi:MAG: LytTR family DNA-binding domain-containing protein [Ferruginibacter sp.]
MPQILTYIIVDDEEIDRISIEAEAARFPFLKKKANCAHALEAIEIIERNPPDIIFTDIQMPDINGLQLIRKISNLVAAPVFITSHTEFALDGFELEVFDYILKPLNHERFAKCVLRLQDFFELRSKAFAYQNNEPDFIIIRQGHDKYKIALKDIIYLEAMKDYTKIITLNGNYLVLTTFANMLKSLSVKFIQVHRSFIINSEQFSAMKDNKLYLDKYVLPIGKLYRQKLADLF